MVKIPAGQTNNVPLMTIDLLPTLCNLAGANLPARSIDGVDASNVLFGNLISSPHDGLVFYSARNYNRFAAATGSSTCRTNI
ncbi:MAG: hypothetical protein R3C28_27490 [Pirellulaceae bacterium]